ncbi:MAG TPA: glycosyltransferase family 39 protein [Stellaceae bacterium]|nr:glycosyltransferase family 39 protein [Stellaceae bacterium]
MAIKGRAVPVSAEDERYLRLTLLCIFAVTAARLVWLRVGGIDLYPDEAQYWLWSLTPDWGYYSKPPLVAWAIRLTTSLFGEDEAAIRLSAPLFHFGTALVIYQIARRLYDARVGMWSAIAYATLPGVSFSAMIISTDVPLLFFWAVALYAFIRAREEGGGRWWIAVGIAAGFGLLSKYAMAYWLLSAPIFLLAIPGERRHLPRFLGATALALAIYAPNFVWNLSHQFVSYRHTEANANITGFALHPEAFGEFLGSQFGVFGPIFFGTLLLIVVLLRRALADRRAQLLAVFALPTLAMMVIVSLLSRAQPNWSAPTYVSGVVLVVAFLLERGWSALIAGSIGLHLAAAAVAFGAYDVAALAGYEIPGKYEPLRRLRGWAQLGRSVGALLRQYPSLRLMSDNREVLAALIYYVRPHPFNALKWNETRRVHDQFDMTVDVSEVPGADVLFVGMNREPGGLGPHFNETLAVGRISISLGVGTTRDFVWAALGGFKSY